MREAILVCDVIARMYLELLEPRELPARHCDARAERLLARV